MKASLVSTCPNAPKILALCVIFFKNAAKEMYNKTPTDRHLHRSFTPSKPMPPPEVRQISRCTITPKSL